MNSKLALSALLCAASLHAQLGRTTDWWTYAGDAQRTNFEKNEGKFVKEDVGNFRVLFEQKLAPSTRKGSLLPPVILGNLIGYRGFKELAIVAGTDNTIWSIDADLARMYWTRHIDTAKFKSKKKNCTALLTAVPALPGPIVFHATPTPPPKPAKPGAPERLTGFTARFMLPNPVYVLSGDGTLHLLNQSDGSDRDKPMPFLPPGVTAQPLTLAEDILYTSTRAGCGQDAAIWSIDTGEEKTGIKSFKPGADIAGLSGVALGADGTVFAQTAMGPLDPSTGKLGGTVLALTKDLTLLNYFILPAAEGKKQPSGMNVTSPIVVTYSGRQLVVTANADGRLYLLNANSVGGDDHHHFLGQSPVIPSVDGVKGHGIWGSLSAWADADGSTYVLAPVWGPLSAAIKAALPKAAAAQKGSVVAFKLQDVNGSPSLIPAWVSPDLQSPSAPVIAKGVVFALANGKSGKNGHATLYALDGITGEVIYSTAGQIKSTGNLTGLSIANGRIYFVTVDNTLHAVGKYLEH